MGAGGYFYYDKTQATINQLKENAIRMEEANKSMKETMGKMQEEAKRNEQLNRELSSALQKAEGKLDKLRSRFSEIDITAEARNDPIGLAIRVNRAVDRLRKELADETTKNLPSDTANTGASGK